MINITDKSKCCGCQACYNMCPRACINMEIDEEGFVYPRVNKELCCNCGMCETVCPFNTSDSKKRENNAYAVIALNDNVREHSSSGGVFSLLSNAIIDKGGVIYGVSMSEDMKSAHFIRALNEEEVQLLRGSKYLQAQVNTIFKCVKSDLDIGKHVLFSGVPCQVAALKKYLKKDYETLVTVEVICHGTPSPKLWSKYIEQMEEDYNTKITNVNFREKRNGWKCFGLLVEGTGNFSYYENLKNDPYMIMFLRNYSLRPSCYACRMKTQESYADLTIADFWGIEYIDKSMFDDKGTSLVLTHTNKGRCLFSEIANVCKVKELPLKKALRGNSAYSKSVEWNKEREHFFMDMNSMTFSELKSKYCPLDNTKNDNSDDNFVKRSIKKLKNLWNS